MTAEFVLLLALTVFTAWSVAMTGPRKVFTQAGPKLGARLERQLSIGDSFKTGGARVRWE